jgi:WD40 repeat protein
MSFIIHSPPKGLVSAQQDGSLPSTAHAVANGQLPAISPIAPAASAALPHRLPSDNTPDPTSLQKVCRLPTTADQPQQHQARGPVAQHSVTLETRSQNVMPQTESRPPNVPRPMRLNTPPSSRKARSAAKTAPTSPANYRSRAKVAAWKSSTVGRDVKQQATSAYFSLERRPYRESKERREILKGSGRLSKIGPKDLDKPHIFHVDFTLEEARKLQMAARRMVGSEKKHNDPVKDLAKLLKTFKSKEDIDRLGSWLETKYRNPADISGFLIDVSQKKATVQDPRVLSIGKDVFDTRGEALRDSRVSSLLMAREVAGNRFRTKRMRHLTNEFHKSLEDGLELRTEFTNCAGDISAVSWVSNTAYIAGTTVHMDSHNQQYNKPGNLLLGSVAPALTMLKSYPDHRIPRPVIEKGENSTGDMRESQDPWLYTSVVSSDHDPIHNRTYTSGFDRSAKVWRVDKSGSSMQCIGTWMHKGFVNFVQASQLGHASGLVATAADVPTEAVRIYTVNQGDISSSPYRSFSATRVPDSDGTFSNKWTYFPSTMKWGAEHSVRHLLLVGFSPRSLTDDENDIPEDRRNTGELCLWDGITGQAVRIPGANTQNVFEVLWHPYRPEFIAATSPAGEFDADIRTQVKIFARDKALDQDVQFKFVKSFDCTAFDINELTIMPNSPSFFYITAGCTDGKTYVWDSAQPETLRRRPIHVLAHGPPLEGIAVGDNEDDTGVKFTAWAASMDRFYTGSSDGLVKVWNIRGRGAKGRVILEAPAQISHGAFSPDYSKLVIGDASGRVFILSVGEDEEKPPSFVSLSGPPGLGQMTRRRPTPITPHDEPPPPPQLTQRRETNFDLGRAYVNARRLKFSGDRTVGMVQDVNYAETGLFRREAHADHDPTKELMAYVESQQKANSKMHANAPIRTKRVKRISLSSEDANHMAVDEEKSGVSDVARRHEENCRPDLNFDDLSLETRDALEKDGVPLQELRDGVEYLGLEYIDEMDENLKKGIVDRNREDDDGLCY